MKSDLSLSIQKPCGENFNDFEPRNNGGFCQACQKTVIDFSSMSNEEIKTFFENRSAGKVCGRFKQSQLTHFGPKSAPVNNSIASRAALIGLPLLSLLPSSAYSQNTESKPRMEQIDSDSTKKTPVDSTWISGTIVSQENGESIPLTSIYLKGGKAGCSSDFDGHFKFPQALKEGDTLIFTFIGFEPFNYIVKADHPKQDIKIQMKQSSGSGCSYTVMGEVATNQKFGSKPSLWKRITGLFRY